MRRRRRQCPLWRIRRWQLRPPCRSPSVRLPTRKPGSRRSRFAIERRSSPGNRQSPRSSTFEISSESEARSISSLVGAGDRRLLAGGGARCFGTVAARAGLRESDEEVPEPSPTEFPALRTGSRRFAAVVHARPRSPAQKRHRNRWLGSTRRWKRPTPAPRSSSSRRSARCLPAPKSAAMPPVQPDIVNVGDVAMPAEFYAVLVDEARGPSRDAPARVLAAAVRSAADAVRRDGARPVTRSAAFTAASGFPLIALTAERPRAMRARAAAVARAAAHRGAAGARRCDWRPRRVPRRE